jgi:hypothetical protein
MISTIELTHSAFGFIHPERMKITQPRVARNEPPRVKISRLPTLKGLNQSTTAEMASTLSGLYVSTPTQGRRCCANPGLSDCNPVGVAADD